MFFETLKRWTVALDDAVRQFDFWQHRTAGGRLHRWVGIDRHTPPALLLPAGLCALLVLASPAPARIGMAVLVGLGVAALLALVMRWTSLHRRSLKLDLGAQIGVVLVVAAACWFGRPDSYRDSGTYKHLLVPVAASLAIALGVGGLLVDAVFRRLQQHSRYGEYLKVTELFASRGPDPDVTVGTLATALLTVAFRAPLALLTLPAITALVVPPAWLLPVPGAVLGVCLLALFVAGLNRRFDMMWKLAQEVFFKGGALLISLLIIVLAALRIAGVTYVTTLLDTAAWWTLGVILASAYVLSWWYDYWTQRLLTDQVLRMIEPGAAGAAGIAYAIAPRLLHTTVPASARVLQVHGASRFIAVREGQPTTFFQSYSLPDLVTLLALTGAPGGKALPPPVQVAGRVSDFHVVVLLVFAALVGGIGWQLHLGEQLPQVRLQQATTRGVSLSQLLQRPMTGTDDGPLIVIAASGGGTRAAVYTAAMLEGLAGLGKADNVVLGSGVSGGGAALAYFAGYRPALVAGTPRAWQDYFDVMTAPFIQDVLERSSEWRMVGSGRLGMLLASSFEARWQLPADRATLESIHDMGLILNTALAGHFSRPPQAIKTRPLSEVEPEWRHAFSKSTLAGGRLLLTNLDFPAALASTPLEPQVDAGDALKLPIIIRSPQLRLEQAAALNANFPPVFSNAAIDVDDTTRYWVTDGGAVDNRGMEMMLYALRLVLDQLPPDRLPRLHVIVADASAFSDAYSQDRGVSSMAGAGSHFASHLNAELVAAIRKRYEGDPQRFQFSYVMMPDLLRRSGSFGTHWMLQGTITVEHEKGRRTISGREMVQVIRALHTPGAERGLGADACTVLLWSREDASHQRGWAAVRQALGGPDVAPACTPN